MEELRQERNALLRYALLHPPPGVTVRLPPGASSFDQCDLTACPSPLALYAEAESESSHGAAGQRRRSSGSTSKRPPRALVYDLGAYVAPPAPADTTATSTSDGTGPAAATAVGKGGAPSPASADPSEGQSAGNGAAHPQGGVSGFFGRLMRGGATPTDKEKVKAPPPPRTPDPPPAEEEPAHGGGGGSNLLNFFTRGRGHHAGGGKAPSPNKKGRAGAAAGADGKGGPGSGPSSPLREARLTPLPLNGTSAGSLSEYIMKFLRPRLGREDAASPASWVPLPPAVLQPMGALDPIVIELCPVIDQSMLGMFDQYVMLTVYEHVLSAVNFLMDVDKDKYEKEVFGVYRRACGVSSEQHMRCMANLIPPHLRQGVVDREQLRLYIEGIRPDVRTLRAMIAASTDDEFIGRMTAILDSAVRNPDTAGPADDSTLYPLAARAALYALSLVPIYRLDPQTGKPLHTAPQIANCSEKLRQRLMVSRVAATYCHVHARLLANDHLANTQLQFLFLKQVAKAVNALGARSLEKERLTPAVKYCYYVLQETLGMSMTPMPWLEALHLTPDAMKSVSAVFLEACAVLPPCFLAAFVQVNGGLVLPPVCTNGSFLYAFLSNFIAAGTLRKFGDSGEATLAAVRGSSTGGGRGLKRLHAAATMLSALGEFDTVGVQYCQLLRKSLPLSPCLALPARLCMANYVLDQQWRRDAEATRAAGGTAATAADEQTGRTVAVGAAQPYPIPPTAAEDVAAALHYLAAALPPDTPSVGDDREVTTVVSAFVVRTLYSISDVVRRCDDAHFGSLAAAMAAAGGGESSRWGWGTTDAVAPHAEAPPEAVRSLVQRYGHPLLPPPLTTAPLELQTARVRGFVDNIAALLRALSLDPVVGDSSGSGPGDGPSAREQSMSALHRNVTSTFSGSPAPDPTAVPRGLVEYRRLAQLRLAATPMTELLQRLEAVSQLQLASARYLAECKAQYRKVAAVTGAADMHYSQLTGRCEAMLADALAQLCERVAAQVLCVRRESIHDGGNSDDDSHDTVSKSSAQSQSKHGKMAARRDSSVCGLMLNQFMKTDTAAYKQQKRKGLTIFGGGNDKAAEGPMPKAHPHMSVDCLMLQLDDAIGRCVAGHVPPGNFLHVVRCCTAAFFVSLLYAVYIEDFVEEVFLTPADACRILRDLDTVAVHYFGGDGDQQQQQQAGGGGERINSLSMSLSMRISQSHADPKQKPSSGGASAGPELVGKGPRLLTELRGIVRYVMLQPSSILVGGGDGVPRLSALPDFEDNSPWSRYTVRRVLGRRKDKSAKQALTKWFGAG